VLNAVGSAANTDPANAWGSLVAAANDIIQFDGSAWTVSFDSSAVTAAQYVSNITTGLQYLWNGQSWVKSYEGLYAAGSWSVVL
jgi:hypothetical protein